MNSSFLTSTILKFYPQTADKIKVLIESNKLLEKLAASVYEKIDASVQKYAEIADRLKVISRLVKAWQQKKYTDISYTAIFLSAAILSYFISPIDLIPDFIPFIGGYDDVLLLGYLLRTIDKEIQKFLEWEKKNQSAAV